MKQNQLAKSPTRKKLNYEVGYYRFGEVAEWLNAAVLKTVERCPRSEGSNPSLSAIFGGPQLHVLLPIHSRFAFRYLLVFLRHFSELTFHLSLFLAQRSSRQCVGEHSIHRKIP